MTVEQLHIAPLEGYDPEIGRWLWALQDVRHRYTLRLVKDLDERLVDWEGPDGQENAIASLLYHIAHVEIGWLYGDVKRSEEHTSELQSRLHLVCRLLLEKKKKD